MEPRQERIAKIALAAGARYGLALAGGYAVRAHGIGSRPSGDVDLFTTWQHRDDFPELTSAVVSALTAAGYATSVIMSGETFARLIVTDPLDGQAEKLELSADWRAHDPVQLDVGPVLHPDDAVANKVCALFGRALPRDECCRLVSWRGTISVRQRFEGMGCKAAEVIAACADNACSGCEAGRWLPPPRG
jgi:Nucleotidyl transferase AbiEii toxin, Type IV TA system